MNDAVYNGKHYYMGFMFPTDEAALWVRMKYRLIFSIAING